jgi:hypothetical protein
MLSFAPHPQPFLGEELGVPILISLLPEREKGFGNEGLQFNYAYYCRLIRLSNQSEAEIAANWAKITLILACKTSTSIA